MGLARWVEGEAAGRREAGLRAALDGRLGLRQGEVGRRATDWDQGLGQRRETEERHPPCSNEAEQAGREKGAAKIQGKEAARGSAVLDLAAGKPGGGDPIRWRGAPSSKENGRTRQASMFPGGHGGRELHATPVS